MPAELKEENVSRGKGGQAVGVCTMFRDLQACHGKEELHFDKLPTISGGQWSVCT